MQPQHEECSQYCSANWKSTERLNFGITMYCWGYWFAWDVVILLLCTCTAKQHFRSLEYISWKTILNSKIRFFCYEKRRKIRQLTYVWDDRVLTWQAGVGWGWGLQSLPKGALPREVDVQFCAAHGHMWVQEMDESGWKWWSFHVGLLQVTVKLEASVNNINVVLIQNKLGSSYNIRKQQIAKHKSLN